MGEHADKQTETSAKPYPKPAYWLAILGLLIILCGGALANFIRTTDGVSVEDIRFSGADGKTMSALLYIPQGATKENPAPGILAVHGYINSRETQDGFAIEFARRGYVVLSLDQTGHGYSDGPAFSNGFGGPDGLRHLRSLPMVDKNNIGLEGHSMGGWTILAAAAEMPDAYKSMVLEGSSTGAPFAQEGSPQWPRNLALVFSRYDEFSKIMWGMDRAVDTPQSPKLQAVFGAQSNIQEGKLYGSIADGTARVLHQPGTTHPGNHFSRESIGKATDWFAKTLEGGSPRPASDQIWYWKEFGTGIGLIGFVMLMLGVFDILIRAKPFAAIRNTPSLTPVAPTPISRDSKWWRMFALSTALPALIFFPAFIAAGLGLPASTFLPQAVTTQVMVWALLSAGLTLLINRFGPAAPPSRFTSWLHSIVIAILSVAAAYLALLLVDRLFHTDLRLWVVAIKWPSFSQWGIAAIYVIPLTAAFLITLRPLTGYFLVDGDSSRRRYLMAIALLASGFAIMIGTIYGIFFATGVLITSLDPLSTVIALQFVPMLTAMAIITIFCWHRTGSHRPGALIAGIFVTLYVVAGTATQI